MLNELKINIVKGISKIKAFPYFKHRGLCLYELLYLPAHVSIPPNIGHKIIGNSIKFTLEMKLDDIPKIE